MHREKLIIIKLIKIWHNKNIAITMKVRKIAYAWGLPPFVYVRKMLAR